MLMVNGTKAYGKVRAVVQRVPGDPSTIEDRGVVNFSDPNKVWEYAYKLFSMWPRAAYWRVREYFYLRSYNRKGAA